ncbi:uncharacterized protein LOC144767694 [Lissotriton helveticus]
MNPSTSGENAVLDLSNMQPSTRTPPQELLDSTETPSLYTYRVSSVAVSPHTTPSNQQAPPATPTRALDFEDAQIASQCSAAGVKQEVAEQMRLGRKSVGASVPQRQHCHHQRHLLSALWPPASPG